MRRASVWLIVGVLLLWAKAAGAASPNLNYLLHGDYAGTGASFCVQSPQGFYPNFTPISTSPSIFSSGMQGVWTFNGDGTGKRVATSVSVSYSDASSDEGEGSFTYTVTSPRPFELSMEVFAGTYLTGRPVGQTYTNGPYLLTGTISEDRKALTFSATEPYVMTQTTFPSGTVNYRICQRTYLGFRQ